MAISGPKKVGFSPIEVPQGEKSGSVDVLKAGAEFSPETIKKLIGSGDKKITSAYFFGAPFWSDEKKAKLFNFVNGALQKNAMFAEKPHAREYVSKKVCEAIYNSPNLTALFFPKVS